MLARWWRCGKAAKRDEAPKRGGLFRSRRPAAADDDPDMGATELAAVAQPTTAIPLPVPRLQLTALSLASAEAGGSRPGLPPATDLQCEPSAQRSPAYSSEEEFEEPEIQPANTDQAKVQEETEEEARRTAALAAVTDNAAELCTAAQRAKAHRPACLALASFGAGLCEALHLAKPALPATPASADRWESLAALLGNSAALAASCGAPGWLMLAAGPEGSACEGMRLVLGKMAALVKEEGLEALPGLRLTAPDLRDDSRALHRRLRQLGGGSLVAGVRRLAGQEEEQHRLASALGLEAWEVSDEAAHVLAAGLAASQDEAREAADAEVLEAHRAGLEAAYRSYACFGLRGGEAAAAQLDSFRCSKLAMEAKLLGPGLSGNELDVLFAKAARGGRGGRRLTFEGFLHLLALVADKKGAPLDIIASSVADAQARGGPAVRGTQAEAVRFHDDRSAYTGVYARGGPAVVDDRLELSRMVDRDAADKAASRRASMAGVTPLARRSISTAAGEAAAPCLTLTPPLSRLGTVAERELPTPGTGASVCGRGRGGNGNATPRLPGNATPRHGPAAAHLTPRGAAAAGGELTPRTGAGAGPTPLTTAASRRALTPRGATPSGLRPAGQAGQQVPLSARGHPAPSPRPWGVAPACPAAGTPRSSATPCGNATPRGNAATPRGNPAATPRATAAGAVEAGLSEEEASGLHRLFGTFAAFGRAPAAAGAEPALDSAQFAKLVREAGLLGRGLDLARADLIFRRAVGKGARRLSFALFLESLPRLAEARGLASPSEVASRLLACEGPACSGATTPDAVRLFDDKSNFTGVAGRGGPSTVDPFVTLAGICDRSERRMSPLGQAAGL